MEFRTDRIGHCVEAGIAFLGKQHLAHKAFKLCTAIGKCDKLGDSWSRVIVFARARHCHVVNHGMINDTK